MARMQNAITSHELPLKKGQTVKLVQLAFVDCVCQSWLTAAFWFGPLANTNALHNAFAARTQSFRFKVNFGFLCCFRP